ncbi:MAG: permease of phosphate ABC transporter [Oscillospiraceae bacterium]|nr:permease of phosphate ABC transporter [Oscillospiraceae bacterium]
MNWLFDSADEFLRKSTWKDLALLKICLFSVGILFGTRVARRDKLRVRLLARLTFLLTYIPLMGKYIAVLAGMRGRERAEEISA